MRCFFDIKSLHEDERIIYLPDEERLGSLSDFLEYERKNGIELGSIESFPLWNFEDDHKYKYGGLNRIEEEKKLVNCILKNHWLKTGPAEYIKEFSTILENKEVLFALKECYRSINKGVNYERELEIFAAYSQGQRKNIQIL